MALIRLNFCLVGKMESFDQPIEPLFTDRNSAAISARRNKQFGQRDSLVSLTLVGCAQRAIPMDHTRQRVSFTTKAERLRVTNPELAGLKVR